MSLIELIKKKVLFKERLFIHGMYSALKKVLTECVTSRGCLAHEELLARER